MEFIGIIGNRGSGKTNLLTSILKTDHDRGIPIIANYKLKFPSITMSFEDIRNLPDRVQGCSIGLDEFGMGVDSYEFMSKNVKEITTLITQIRKRHSKVYYTVQRFGLIAKRLRDQTDGFILMRDLDESVMHYPDGTPVETHRDVCAGLFEATFLDADQRPIRKRIFDGHESWNLYDTDEIIWG